VVAMMEETVQFETDLRMEAAAATRLRDNLKNDTGFYVPRIYWEYTAHRILTLERITGLPIHNVAAIKAAGHNLEKLVDIAAVSFFKQVFRDGFFHADMHPGNLFVRPDGTLAVVDFGIMGRLDKPNRIFLAQVLHGFLTEDYSNVAKVHFEMGIVPPHKSQEAFELALMAITKPILGKALKEISFARLLGQLISTAESFEMEAQPQLLLLHKNMMITEGVGLMLNPDVNMWQVAQPLIEEWAKSNLGPRAWIKDHAEETVSLLKSIPTLVRDAQKFGARDEERRKRDEEQAQQTAQKLKLQKQFLWLGWAVLAVFVLKVYW
jgi:ubiquinone biosynthesis protein